MSSTSEVGHAKNVANLQKLTEQVTPAAQSLLTLSKIHFPLVLPQPKPPPPKHAFPFTNLT